MRAEWLLTKGFQVVVLFVLAGVLYAVFQDVGATFSAIGAGIAGS